MSLIKKNKQRRQRRELRVRSAIKSKTGLPRISVFRSLNYIYGQLINDNEGNTISSCSSLELKNLTGDKKTIAKNVGLELAKKALKAGISEVVLDRGRFLYHGRIKAFAEGLREGGLKL